jgi:DNA-binding HxlR family transcriptional regulator
VPSLEARCSLGSRLREQTLACRLSDLAGAGLIARTVDDGPPVAVSYALTDRGKALVPAREQISLWAQEHLVDDES